MKKGLLLFCALTTVGLTSCGQDDENVQQTEIKTSAKNDLSAKFKEYAKSQLNNKNTSRIAGSVEYDFDKVYYNQESNGYFFLQKDYDINSNDEQMAIFAGIDERGEFTGLVEMGSTKTQNGKFTIKYYDAEQVLASVDFDYKKDEQKVYFSNIQNESLGSKKNCGQGAATCIQDAYSNHGWMSVALWAETLWLPQTGFAVAGACVIKNCIVH